MNPAYTIFIEIGIALISAGLTWLIAIKVQFAKDEKTAINNAIDFIFKLAAILFNAFITYSLVAEFLSPEPLTKKSLFFILIYSFVLFYALISSYISKLLYLQREQSDLTARILDSNRKQSDLTTRVLDSHGEHLQLTQKLINKIEKKKK